MGKPEDLLLEYNRARLNEEAVNIEKVHFYKTDKRVNPKQEDPFWLTAGKLPVLVCAPHAVRHLRNKKIKMSDQFTGSMVYLLNRLTGCHAMATTKLYGGDPHYDSPCLFKEKIAEFVRQEQVKFIVDIHGAAREYEYDLDIHSNNGRTLLNKGSLLDLLTDKFLAFGFWKISYNHSSAYGQNTISNYAASALKIPAVQVEINKQFRVPAQNSQGFHRIMGALTEIIEELAGKKWGERHE